MKKLLFTTVITIVTCASSYVANAAFNMNEYANTGTPMSFDAISSNTWKCRLDGETSDDVFVLDRTNKKISWTMGAFAVYSGNYEIGGQVGKEMLIGQYTKSAAIDGSFPVAVDVVVGLLIPMKINTTTFRVMKKTEGNEPIAYTCH